MHMGSTLKQFRLVTLCTLFLEVPFWHPSPKHTHTHAQLPRTLFPIGFLFLSEDITHVPPKPSFLIHVLTLITHLHLSLPICLLTCGSETENFHAFLIVLKPVTCSAHLNIFQQTKYVIRLKSMPKQADSRSR
jgi:hypothetical protein